MNFASDNWAGAAPEVMEALRRANDGFAPAYGDDAWTARAASAFAQIFGRECGVTFVASGTAANALSMAAAARPGGLIFCSGVAHILTSEHGASEFFTGGMRLVPVPTADGLIAPDALETALAAFPDDGRHQAPAILSLTQASECGTVYAPDHVARLAKIAHARGMAVHMDGARFANAAAHLGCAPADLTWSAGVDILSFGATKNGAMAAEAIVTFDDSRFPDLDVLCKRSGHVMSKARFTAAQFEALLTDGLWLRLAGHANAMARRLADGIEKSGGRLHWPAPANEVFAVLPSPTVAALRAAGATFHSWEVLSGGEEIVRLVTCFATSETEVDAFVEALA